MINMGYEIARDSDFATTTLARPFMNDGFSLTESLKWKDNYWDSCKTLSYETMRNVLGGDSNSPYYNAALTHSNQSANLALLITPFGRFSTGAQAAKTFAASKAVPKVGSNFKTNQVSRLIFQSNKKGMQDIHSFSIPDLKRFFSSAKETYKGSSRIGHSISKHAGRNPEIWGKLEGPMFSWTNKGIKHFKEIYRAPGDFISVKNPHSGITFIEKRLTDGRGIRLNRNKTFKGFID